MRRNLGTIDLVIRAMLGIALLAFFATEGSFIEGSLPGLLIGSYLVASAVLCFCPIYKALDFSTYGPLDESI